MSGWGILGGIGQGISAGVKDLEHMDEAKYNKKLRKRQQEEWEEEDKIGEQVKGLDPSMQPSQKTKELARIYQGAKSSKLREKGIQYENQARQFSREDIADRSARMAEMAKAAGMLHSMGNHEAALRVLQGGYDLYPDGRKIVTNPDNTWGVQREDGTWEVAPRPIDLNTVGEAVNFAMKFQNPQLWAALQQDKRADRQIEQHDKQIANQETQIRQTGAYQQGMLDRYHQMQDLQREEFEAKKRGGMFARPPASSDNFHTMGTPQLFSDGQGKTVMGVPILDKRTGQMSWQTVDAPAGMKSVREKPQLTMKDVATFTENYGHLDSGQKDLSGKPIPIRNLPFQEQRKLAMQLESLESANNTNLPDPKQPYAPAAVAPQSVVRKPQAFPPLAAPGSVDRLRQQVSKQKFGL